MPRRWEVKTSFVVLSDSGEQSGNRQAELDEGRRQPKKEELPNCRDAPAPNRTTQSNQSVTGNQRQVAPQHAMPNAFDA